ncbi:LysR family transcriptional regulator [Novosphingobium sp. LASN5T]|uniref:LysR family transcriptional regulator n=1 Tax=Novosphingobium sp. LASN5T TaxID=2491021 RepID=UPI000F5EF91F|nr:LysR family transcriptional regulator [Novosphingobium sp. LASN5T]RQW39382.1 LysR family transcriptional regulator [Novosphingobium sp. LASN5T]
MNLQQLRQLVALADTLNFRRAAEKLNMAQPPLSISLAKLEAEFGVRLFARDRRKVTLTAAGAAALPHAAQALFHIEQVKAAVRESLLGSTGRLRIGFVGSATYSLLPKLLSGFRLEYPSIDLSLEESYTTALLQKLSDREIDAALVRTPVLGDLDAELHVLEHDSLVAVVKSPGPYDDRSSIDISELRDAPLITHPESAVPNMRAVMMLMCHEAGFQPNVVQEAIQAQTMISLVQSGIGVALVAGVTRHYSATDIKFLKIKGSEHSNRIGLALALPRDQRSRVTEKFLDFALRQAPCDSRLA